MVNDRGLSVEGEKSLLLYFLFSNLYLLAIDTFLFVVIICGRFLKYYNLSIGDFSYLFG